LLAMAVSVVMVTLISLAFVGAAALLQMQVDKAKDDWYDRVEVNVYLCPAGEASQSCPDGEVTEEQIEELRGLLESDALADYVQTVYLETKEQARSAPGTPPRPAPWSPGRRARRLRADRLPGDQGAGLGGVPGALRRPGVGAAHHPGPDAVLVPGEAGRPRAVPADLRRALRPPRRAAGHRPAQHP